MAAKRHPQQQNRRGFSASHRNRRKCCEWVCMRGYPHMTRRLCRCRCAAMREYAAKRGWEIAAQIKEVGSGAVEREFREKLMAAARRREIDVVLVWRLDRWGRSLADLVVTLKELAELGVGFVSLTEALDLTTPTGRAMAGLLSVFAEFEHEILRERIRAGIVEARRKGTRLGRPITAAKKAAQIRKLHRAGISKAEIARRLEIGRTSVRRILADL
jgi:putative DNA-invertase from lambdoid prophage Rac